MNHKLKHNPMRKISSLLICLILVLSFAVSSYAEVISIVRPSVEVKDVSIVSFELEIVNVEDPDGEPIKIIVAGTLVESEDPDVVADGKELKYYDISEVYLTPYAQKDAIPYVTLSEERKEIIKKNLEEAFSNILSLDTLGSLNAQLEERAKKIDPNFNSWVFVASDIFDISLDEAEEKFISENPDMYFRLTIKLTHPVDSLKDVAVMHCPQSTGKWSLLPEENVTLNEDGTLTLIFDSLCPVVVMTAQPERMQEYKEAVASGRAAPVKSGNCRCPSWCPFCSLFCRGDSCFCIWALIILIIIIAVLVAVIIVFRNKLAKDRAREDNMNRILAEARELEEKRKE